MPLEGTLKSLEDDIRLRNGNARKAALVLYWELRITKVTHPGYIVSTEPEAASFYEAVARQTKYQLTWGEVKSTAWEFFQQQVATSPDRVLRWPGVEELHTIILPDILAFLAARGIAPEQECATVEELMAELSEKWTNAQDGAQPQELPAGLNFTAAYAQTENWKEPVWFHILGTIYARRQLATDEPDVSELVLAVMTRCFRRYFQITYADNLDRTRLEAGPDWDQGLEGPPVHMLFWEQARHWDSIWDPGYIETKRGLVKAKEQQNYLLLTTWPTKVWNEVLPRSKNERLLIRVQSKNVHSYPSSKFPPFYYQFLHWLDNLASGVNQLVSVLLSLTIVVDSNSFGQTELLTLFLVITAIISSHPALEFPGLETAETKTTHFLRSSKAVAEGDQCWGQRSIHSFQVPKARLLPKYIFEVGQLVLGMTVYAQIVPAETNRLFRAIVIISVIESLLSIGAVFLVTPAVLLPVESALYAMSLLPGDPTGVIVHVSGSEITLESWWIYRCATGTRVSVSKKLSDGSSVESSLKSFVLVLVLALFLPWLVLPVLLRLGREKSGAPRYDTDVLFSLVQFSAVAFVLWTAIAMISLSFDSLEDISLASDSDSLLIRSRRKLEDILIIGYVSLGLALSAFLFFMLFFVCQVKPKCKKLEPKCKTACGLSMALLTAAACCLAVAGLIYYATWRTRFINNSETDFSGFEY